MSVRGVPSAFVTGGSGFIGGRLISRRDGQRMGAGGTPPITRMAYWLMALETMIDISRAQAELSYRPVTSIADGMAAL